MGRPRIFKQRAQLNIYFEHEELMELLEAARTNGMKLAPYTRYLILHALRRN